MQIFISEKLEKQINKEFKYRKDIISRLDDLVERLRLLKKQSDCNEIKGFKAFVGTKYPVFGFDIGLNKSLTMSGERLIVSFVDLHKDYFEIFKRVVDKDDLKIDTQGVLFHMICKHDEQNTAAKMVDSNYISYHEYIDASKYFTKEETNSLNESMELKSKYKMYVDDKYLNPKVTVLSLDKYDIIEKFVYTPQPMLIRGVAGSGKTEIIIKIIHDLLEKIENKKILYVTLSLDLKQSVEEKTKTFKVRKNNIVNFETVKSLYGRYIKDENIEKRYESFSDFEEFVIYYRENENKNFQLKNKILKFIENHNMYNIYSEIYGLIYGYMMKDWDRKNSYMLSKNEYINIYGHYKIFSEEEQNIIYEIALLYEKYCLMNGLSLYNRDSIDIMNMENSEKYDYIFVDEVQDLTEVQISTIYSLVKNSNNIYLTGDEKQVINPTFFKDFRLYDLFKRKGKELFKPLPLNSNFRNSKSVTELINYYNSIREKYLPVSKEENRLEEESKNISSGHIYNFIGDTNELIEKMENSSNSAIIVDEDEYETIKKENKINERLLYTAQKIKGIEFDNILVMDMLSQKKELYDYLYEHDGRSKDSTLHYHFNLFYVAITRSIYNLIISEKLETKIYNELLDNVESIMDISDIDDLNLSFDTDAFSFFQLGKKNLEKKDYERALRNFDKAKSGTNFEEIDMYELNKYIDITKIYLSTKSDKELARKFEENKYYDFALKHYQNINDYNKSALMCLLLPDYDNRFRNIIIQEKINIFDLYSDNIEYNKAIDEYFERKYNYISNYTSNNEIINELIKDTITKINI